MRIAVGSDHVGVALKQAVIEHLIGLGHQPEDFGTQSTEMSDYPVYADRVAHAVTGGGFDCGVLICGTGIGISIAANKVQGIRAAVCSEPYSARMARQHNNANIIAFGARVVGDGLALEIVDAFLQAEYEGGRHQRRVDMIDAIEKGEDVQGGHVPLA